MSTNNTEPKYSEMTTAQLRELLHKTPQEADMESISNILQQRREKELLHKAEAKRPATQLTNSASTQPKPTSNSNSNSSDGGDEGTVGGIIGAIVIGVILLAMGL